MSIGSVTLFQDGPTERLSLLGLTPQNTHRLPSGQSLQADANTSLTTEEWMHLFSQVDTQNNSLDIFLNGELVAREDLPEDGFPTSPSSAPWRFGLGTLPFALDEFRLSRLPKSADWIKAFMTISQDMLIF